MRAVRLIFPMKSSSAHVAAPYNTLVLSRALLSSIYWVEGTGWYLVQWKNLGDVNAKSQLHTKALVGFTATGHLMSNAW